MSTRLHAHATLVGIGLALHLLADLDVDVEELGHAAVEADGLALVEVAFAVIGGDTLLGARLSQAMIRDGSKLEWVRIIDSLKMDLNGVSEGFWFLNHDTALGYAVELPTYRLNMSEIISTSVSAAEIFSAEDILGAPPKRKDMMYE